MRRLFAIVLVALLLGVGVVAVIETDPGYVLVSYGNYSLETSLWVGLLVLALLLLTVYLLLRLIYRIIGGQRSLFNWLGSRKVQKSVRLSTSGLISYTEGHWARARRELLRGAQNSDAPLGNYLLAARSSEQLHDNDKVHEYLRAAGDAEPSAAVAVQITLAEMKLQAGEYEQALAALESAKNNGGRHPYTLNLLCQIYRGQKDWDKLFGLLPELRKRKLFGTEELQKLERQVCHQRLERSAGNLEQLRAIWQQAPRQLQQDTQFLEVYVARLIELGAHDDAEKTILRADRRPRHNCNCGSPGCASSQLSALANWRGTSSTCTKAYW